MQFLADESSRLNDELTRLVVSSWSAGSDGRRGPRVRRPAIGAAFVVGAPLGMSIGLLLRSELEGALALLIFLATQFMTNPERLLAHCLPLWSVRGVADWALWSGDAGDLTNGLAHGAATVTVSVPSEPASSKNTKRRLTGVPDAATFPTTRPCTVVVPAAGRIWRSSR